MLAVALLLGALPAEARKPPAAERAYLACDALAEPPLVDGDLSEWEGVEARWIGRRASRGLTDLAVAVRCAIGGGRLAIAVAILDDRIVRERPGRRGGDRVLLRIGAAPPLRVAPSVAGGPPGRVRAGRRGKRARWLRVAEAAIEGGYAVEAALPVARAGDAGEIVVSLQVDDADLAARPRRRTRLTAAVRLRSRAVAAALAGVRERLGPGARLDLVAVADVLGGPARERVYRSGATLAFLGGDLEPGSFTFHRLPANGGVRWLRVADLDGDGQAEIVARLAQRQADAEREVVVVYRVTPRGALDRVMAHEVARQRGTLRVDCEARLVPRRGGFDLVIERPRTRGFTERSYREAPATDAEPLLLPWKGPRRARYRFEPDGYARVD